MLASRPTRSSKLAAAVLRQPAHLDGELPVALRQRVAQSVDIRADVAR